MKVLVTGGAGYIGSSIVSALIDNGHDVVIIDSLVNGNENFVINKCFYKGDISDFELLKKINSDHPDIFVTIHCAAHIIVPESVEEPYKYYHENIYKSVELFNNLDKLGKKNIIFSSSASIYNPENDFIAYEDSPISADSPYAFSKIVIEQALQDFSKAYGMRVISLRYFNPIGSDPKFRTGPYIKNPSHLLGTLVEVANGRKKVFEINGVDWNTRDGSAIRDYIHVWDLALAHIKAVENFDNVLASEISDYSIINLGSQKGTTVKEFVLSFENVIGYKLNKIETPPRPGDKIGAFASSEKAFKLLNWTTIFSLEDGIKHALMWDEKRKSIIGY